MYEGEGLGRLIIDLDAVLGEVMGHVESEGETWAIGEAITTLYPERVKQLTDRIDMLVRLMNDEPTPNNQPEGESK